ncbi:TRAP transporter substrate-binding protein DctP [Telmatospirillum sp. J64-1]|uniref:TRAP transporter substrate-binding protein DctP n=1 Tax=Telmatospirillum sp. J64-1 TaxID=2502183 RepID=UPI00115E85B3|nr:TRAP transporter substrate-binding protein DctP [Telmatospirillum sp. J64-1]
MSQSAYKTALARVATLAVAVTATMAVASPAMAERLRVSHQWSTNDVRHKIVEIVAEEVKNADVGLELQIFPNASLFKPNDQWTPLTRGQLEMAVLPLAYAAGRHPEFNLTLMPALVKNHEHAARLNNSEFMEEIEKIMNDGGVVTLVRGWLAGGFAAKNKCIVKPEDVQGMQTRAAGRAFEEMLAAAGASISSMPSSEIYSGMQTGVLDAVNTSSSSFVSYRLYEQVKCYTPPGDYALWFMYQPLVMSKRSWDSLNDEQREALRAGAAKAEAYYAEEAAREDNEAIDVYRNAGVEIAMMDAQAYEAWRELAAASSYKAFVASTPNGQKLLDLALSVD